MKEILLGKTESDLQQWVKEQGMPGFVGSQVARWLYGSNITSFGEMTNLSKENRQLLETSAETGIQPPVKVQVSADGTRKYLYPVDNKRYVEAAWMPEAARNTLCLSTQVGCKMGCLFCMTARQGFQGNLTPGEIINQVRILPERATLTNLVYMGMGEPFDNTDSVMKSLEIFTSAWGFGISPRKITVSTIGIIPGIERLLSETSCNLAISLHSPFDEERRKLMPVQHVYPIKEVIATLQKHDISRYRKVSFEYILFEGVNDSPAHVRELARLLNKVRCRINLMRYHTLPGSPLKGSDEAVVQGFRKALGDKGIITTIRQSRGLDIDAACGLLSTRMMLEDQRESY